ncbi:DHH phosphoesterase [Fimicolochytrium jonesii]|uniref:DHH phosphoesterase n=1 Tax=Fimicolochytrium jonesii TaxID=1396493 RepID=UPI0022FE43ED|nr:DHH phosphoesterase [Fimicolochytrium jonesii]KAI8818764.1 DHH phosphoesterase [Fimicolochytrium jonesii]
MGKRDRSPSPLLEDFGAKRQHAWPCDETAMEKAREFVRRCATNPTSPILLLPDRDADGLTGGLIFHRTLRLLGVPPSSITTHFVTKGTSIHAEGEREILEGYGARRVIVVDQGSRGAGEVVRGAEVLVVDHHWSAEFPSKAEVVNASHYPPVATSALLAYLICEPLHQRVPETCAWLAVLGTMGDLGTGVAWTPPFPDLSWATKGVGKSKMGEAVGLLNAPRRTAENDVRTAWQALLASNTAADVVSPSNPSFKRLREAKAEVAAETQKWARTPPKFSSDGRFAVFEISSPAQIHPLIATRWSGYLKATNLEALVVANTGYNPHRVHFACRIPRSRKSQITLPEPDLITLLSELAAKVDGLREKLGDDYARGHKEATGGVVSMEAWGLLKEAMELGVKKEGGGVKGGKKVTQRNTLDQYFKR